MTKGQTEVEGGLDEPTELEPEQGTLVLAAPQDAHTRADWERAAAGVLRKARRLGEDDADNLVWEKLTRTTLDGIDVTPLGTPDLLDDLSTAGRPTRHGDWDIRAQLSVNDAESAHEQALVDLEGGVTSLWLTLGDGVARADLDALLEGVFLDLAPVVLEARGDPLAAARAFVDHLEATVPAAGTNLGLDAQAPDDVLVAVARLALERGVLGVVVDATVVHDRGACDAQELGYSMAAAARVLRVLTQAGIDLDAAVGLIEFRYAVTDEQFAGIAKLRAARRLWARVLELSGATAVPQRQHAVTSRPMMSAYDPYVNLLRTTVAAFAAGVGGADSVTVLAFDSPLGQPHVLGRRVARNTSALLISESHLARVADPAGGAYAVEKLTDDLAKAGWDVLGRVESGESLDDAIAATVEQRERQVAERTRPITGLTEFPHLAEDVPRREADPLAPVVRRYGASFEALRGEPTSAHVFLATLGTVAAHTVRATFATNLMAAGGIAVDVAGRSADVEELLAAYDAQPVVCLAGTDAAYDAWGAAAAATLRERGAQWVIVAGRPRDWADDACATGADALQFLTRTREKLR